MNRLFRLLPYWFLLFTIGFGWFILSPLVPDIIHHLNVGLSSVILLISVYGYTMVVLGLLSGFLSARFSARSSLTIAALLSIAGLLGRAYAGNYDQFLAFQVIAAAAYPLALAPVGSIATSIDSSRSHTIVGISVGTLFLGMAAGSFLAPSIVSAEGLHGTFLATCILAVVALILMLMVIRGYPAQYKGKSLRGSFEPGMVKNWYIGLVISSLAIMFSSIASTSLEGQGVSTVTALSYSGMLGGLSFLGSALGAIILPPVFERSGSLKNGLILTSVLSLVSVFILAFFLGHFSGIPMAASGFFLFGFFGNAFWSMAMTSTTKYVSDPAKAGFATSMFSVATNLGVAFIPGLLGPVFLGNGALGIGIVVIMVLVAFAMSPTLKVRRGEDTLENSAEAA